MAGKHRPPTFNTMNKQHYLHADLFRFSHFCAATDLPAANKTGPAHPLYQDRAMHAISQITHIMDGSSKSPAIKVESAPSTEALSSSSSVLPASSSPFPRSSSPSKAPKMTDEQAAHVMAQHITALQNELRYTTSYLQSQGIDTEAAMDVDVPTTMAQATGVMDWNKKIEVMMARKNCAALVLDALTVARERAYGAFGEFVEKELAKGVAKESIFHPESLADGQDSRDAMEHSRQDSSDQEQWASRPPVDGTRAGQTQLSWIDPETLRRK